MDSNQLTLRVKTMDSQELTVTLAQGEQPLKVKDLKGEIQKKINLEPHR